jgi:hypothetical protein
VDRRPERDRNGNDLIGGLERLGLAPLIELMIETSCSACRGVETRS